ncbi:FAD:protein FMN transferase [Acetohalobium arabaticum]|uniref:FAD:protein FMN transferase n=1 Tax=Acetohalobium arabaticum (strain ATCC 49924 / DSM 5501 / Z-7288) TaxID=574087 RepID=D9QV33_ACEAZ|nr:FAD:protein FMN transferase [Acetohalobium arabaticum]ADL12092.1 ApbE family lipoprotein [Acetohalobium arabaticum DSM 5501]
MQQKKKIGLSLIILLILLVGTITSFKIISSPPEYETKEFLMDTMVSLTVTGNEAKEAGQAAVKAMRQTADEATRYNENSIISRINNGAGNKPVEVTDDLLVMIKTAKEYGRLTDGKFDITVAPVIDLWNFKAEDPAVPSDNKIERRLDLVNYKEININEDKRTVMLAEPGMKLDLGGVAKGYIVDQAAEVLKKFDIESALINAGGNIRTIGTKPNGDKWRIGIRNPRDTSKDSEDNYSNIIGIKETNVVTSGDYERYFMEEGRRYHHILDPNTGYPARGLASVTIVADSSFKADILSTALFILGFDEAKAYIQEDDSIEGMLITTDLNKWQSEGFKKLIVD